MQWGTRQSQSIFRPTNHKRVMPVNWPNSPHNLPVPYPTMHHSEQKCAHFCSEWCIVGYGTGALWDLWDWSIGGHVSYPIDSPIASRLGPCSSLWPCDMWSSVSCRHLSHPYTWPQTTTHTHIPEARLSTARDCPYWQGSGCWHHNNIHIFWVFNSSPPGQNGCHFVEDVLRCIFMNKKFCILIKISLKFVPRGPIDNNPALV